MDKIQINAAQVKGLISTISNFYNSNLYTDRSYFKATATSIIVDTIIV